MNPAHPSPLVRSVQSAPAPAVVAPRLLVAGILTVTLVVLAIALAWLFGTIGILSVAIPLPVGLVLLWKSADVYRSDEHPR